MRSPTPIENLVPTIGTSLTQTAVVLEACLATETNWKICVAMDGGEVTFGGGVGHITGKGTIRTKIMDFENVLYVKELDQFNLISVSQICDKKH
ncbi:hypothetical protein Tco_1517262 [Tanacetum coccineum]